MQNVLRFAPHLSLLGGPARRLRARSRGALLSLLGFACACSGQSAASDGQSPASSAGSPSNAIGGQNSGAGANSAAGSQALAAGTGGASAGSTASGGTASSANGGATANVSGGMSSNSSAGSDGAQCRENVAENEWQANCVVCAGGDVCAECACSKCTDKLRSCETTPGCGEIAACVRKNGCMGAACYCGTANLLDCANGVANGPCKEVILAAPGGKPPTAADPSAGPASDALVAVNNCMQDPNTCKSSCN